MIFLKGEAKLMFKFSKFIKDIFLRDKVGNKSGKTKKLGR